MKLSQYRLIVTDLDGTLVKSGANELSLATIGAIKSLTERGMFFSIATGRSWRQSQAIAGELQITIPVIVQTGAIIVDPITGENIWTIPLRKEIERRLAEKFRLTQVDCFNLDESGVYFTTQINTKGGAAMVEYYGESCVVGKPDQAPAAVVKKLFIGQGEILKELADRICREIRPRPNLILWPPDPGVDDWFLEIFDPLASKGQAVKWLARYLQVKRRQVIAIGDGQNDIDLLQLAGLGVTIEGAPLTIISQADLVIPRPESDGVARFLTGDFLSVCYKDSLKTAKRREA
jgi:Cof subfamily protein (haloacid dehalogenase superfamily)